METKDKIITFFISKINIDFFSRLIKKYRVFRPFYKIAAQRLIDYRYPRHLFVETTSLCNLRCSMCPRNFSPTKPGTMDFELFKKVIDEAKEYGARNFSLHLFGEPLLDKELLEKIKYLKQSNPKNSVLLTTNGVLLNSNVSTGLIKNNVDKIIISIHSPEAKTYREITGQDRLEIVEKNIAELIRLKKESKAADPKIFLRLIRQKANANQIADFQKKWAGHPLKIEIREEHNYGGKIQNFTGLSTPKRYPCYHLWFSPAVNWDGEVSICCDDVGRAAIVGNIRNSRLANFWQGAKINQFRAYHLKGEYHKIPICANCDVWQIYPDIFFKWQKK